MLDVVNKKFHMDIISNYCIDYYRYIESKKVY